MSGRDSIGTASVPRLAPHVRMQFDRARESWVIQAPEKIFLLDEIAHAVVSRCDGKDSLATIVDQLCKVFPDAPRDAIETDVAALVRDFVGKGVFLL